MSWLEIVLLFVGFLIAMAMAGAVVAIGGLLICAARAEKHERAARDPYPPEAAEVPDQLGDDILPDGSPAVQRSRLWSPACRLREDYIEAAESAYDWKAAEADATKRRSR